MMILDRRRYLSGFAVLSLVLLRLVVGWHFFGEGTKKVVYDPHDGGLRMSFSSEGFLTNATGPFAPMYRANAPDGHGWRELLAAPRQNVPATDEQTADLARWQSEYEQRRAEARQKGELQPVEFPETAPYRDWAERIADDWRSMVDDVKALPALSEEQDEQADKALNTRLHNLADYLAANEEAITEYRHELWRLANWRKSPEAGDVPFFDERIATKAGETNKTPAEWVGQVEQFGAALREDLRGLLTDEQQESALTARDMNRALTDPGEKRLNRINVIVTVVTIAVGVCLLLGLFTRVASIVGALFLLGVILSQPPWLPTSAETMPQVIEFVALLVLAGTAAGRWAGLDYFTYALFNRKQPLVVQEV